MFSKNNNQCSSFGLLGFRPTEAILTLLRKIGNTQLRFMFLNFLLCVKIASIGLKLDRPRCTIGYYYNDQSIKYFPSSQNALREYLMIWNNSRFLFARFF